MGNALDKRLAKLKLRQDDFDSQRNTQGQKRPGSMNYKKQSAGRITIGGKKRR